VLARQALQLLAVSGIAVPIALTMLHVYQGLKALHGSYQDKYQQGKPAKLVIV